MPCGYRLSSIVMEIALRAGMDPLTVDVGLLEGDVAGLTVINTYPAYTALQSLSQVYFFAPSNYDGALHFIPGGGNSSKTITEDDLVDDTEESFEQARRDDSIAVPRVMHLMYYDVEGGLATDKQTSERAGDRRSVGEMSIQNAVMMTAEKAARAVAINHKVAIEELRGTLKFSLPDSFLDLAPADVVIVQHEGKSARLRITRLDMFDGYQQYETVYDRQSAYVSEVEGIPAAPQTPPPSSIVGPTLIEPLDIHILRDADDNLGLLYYVAVSGTLPAWTGCTVELSYDGGANYVAAQDGEVASIMGTLTLALPDHPQAFPDEVHTLTVSIATPFAEFDETDLVGLLNRQNFAIVDDEIIQFATADEVSEGVWELGLLLRGRKGTATASHAPGARFVLLASSTLGIVPASITDLARTLTFRATSFGNPEGSGTVVSMLYAGRSQIEREPGYVMARLEGTDAVVSWQGVGRLGSGAHVAHGIRFDGYRVEFDDGVAPVVTVNTANEELTQDVSALTPPIAIRVMQLNSLTGAGPAIEVIV